MAVEFRSDLHVFESEMLIALQVPLYISCRSTAERSSKSSPYRFLSPEILLQEVESFAGVAEESIYKISANAFPEERARRCVAGS